MPSSISKKNPLISLQSSSENQVIRIVVLGSSGVGKSAIVMQYVQGVFVESYDPTLEDSFTKRVRISAISTTVDVEILDTAGIDQFAAMRDMYIANGDAFVVVYSVDSKVSFNEACALITRIKSVKKKCSIVLLANKVDLAGKHVKVAHEWGIFQARQERCLFAQVSARRNQGIEEAFETLLKQCIKLMQTDNCNSNFNNNTNNILLAQFDDLKSSSGALTRTTRNRQKQKNSHGCQIQ